MTDFFQEVDEDVRRDRTLAFFETYRVAIAVLVVAILVGTGAWRWWQSTQQAAAEAAGARYEAALQLVREGKSAEAEAAFKAIIANGPKGYALLARLRSAASVGEKDPKAAVPLYEAIAADPSVDSLLRDVANLRAAFLRIDAADAGEVTQRIEPLAAPTNPLHASARELLAYAALKRDDFAAAGRWLDLIVTDPQAPNGVRQRAEAMLGLVAAGGGTSGGVAAQAKPILVPTPAQ